MRKIKLTAIALGLMVSTAASAAVSNGNLSFTFVGVVPATAQPGTTWKFLTASGLDYQAPAAINFSLADVATGLQLTSASETFYIKPNGSATFGTNAIKAQLVAEPTISGTAIQASAMNTVVTTVTLNGQTVPVGSDLTIAATGNNAQMLTLGTVVNIPTAARNTAGGTVNVVAPIRFAVDIGA
ncbi:hypothetical protein ABXV24_04105 [Vibrio owensii]|uniref:hypothetical protein n=1 Tax=Vibrio owensii TaxID=696485 RepID=UPI00339A74F3